MRLVIGMLLGATLITIIWARWRGWLGAALARGD